MRLADNPVYQLELSRRQRRRATAIAPLIVMLVNAVGLSLAMYRAGALLHLVILSGCVCVAAACPLGVAVGIAHSVASEFAARRLDALALTQVPAYDILRGKFHATARTALAILAAVLAPDLFAVMVALATGAAVTLDLPAAVVSLAFVGLAGCYLSGVLGVVAAVVTRAPAAALALAAATSAVTVMVWVWAPLAGAPTGVLLAWACAAAAVFLACAALGLLLALHLFQRALSRP